MTRSQRYTSVAIALHWLIALAILIQIAMGLTMTRLGKPSLALKFELYQLHKSVGITVLALSLLRLAWRLAHPPPPLPAAMPRWERAAARASHIGFYVLMIGMPLTGWMLVSASPLNIPTVLYGVVPLPHLPILATLPNKPPVESAFKHVHDTGAWILIALFLLHAGAALRHHFVLRDAVLRRMLPWGRAGLVLAVLLAAAPARAANWRVDPAHSRIGFTGTQVGAPFDGTFARYKATIAFDPANPSSGHVSVDIDMTSAGTGNRQRDIALPESDWFDTRQFPTAHFESTQFRALGGDKFAADGKLTLRGITRAVVLPFTLAVHGDTAEAKGQLDITRTDYGVGQGSWESGTWVGLKVTITIAIAAQAS